MLMGGVILVTIQSYLRQAPERPFSEWLLDARAPHACPKYSRLCSARHCTRDASWGGGARLCKTGIRSYPGNRQRCLRRAV